MRVIRQLAALLCALGLAGTAHGDDLTVRLNTALQHPGLRGASVAALVVRAADGQVLFAHQPDRALVPASNQKVLTALAALATFGPTHHFTTRIVADAPLDAAGAVGTLAVQAGGDPALTSEEWWRLAADLRRLGLRRVRDGVILDDSYFDAQRWNPSWGGGSARAFHAPVAALTANYGSFAVQVDPARRVTIDPPVPYFTLLDQVQLGRGAALSVERRAAASGDEIVVAGRAPARDATTIFRSVSDPVRYAGSVFEMQLRAVGIAVDGPLRVGPLPAGARELLAFEGPSLAEIVRLCMKHSNNNIAEMLVKNLGAQVSGPPGTWDGGLAVVLQQLRAAGVDTTGLRLLDGSGLSHDNRVTPRALVGALRAAQASFAFGPDFLAALPIAGRDGTLGKRAAGARDLARAKTGLLNDAAALSGIAITRGGTTVVFSILVNDFKHADLAIAANDGFVTALVESP
ncbi:MAG: D-alanyl-D-alanine carboxypeptidase/D-alanyl-D-alanine endopeptidase [Candidatus Binatia bacterium]